MQREERVLRDLCIAIAKGDIGGNRFNELLLETGVYLDDVEWEFANRLLGKSDQVMALAPELMAAQQ